MPYSVAGWLPPVDLAPGMAGPLILHFGVVRREEAYLADRFGETCRAYCARRYL